MHYLIASILTFAIIFNMGYINSYAGEIKVSGDKETVESEFNASGVWSNGDSTGGTTQFGSTDPQPTQTEGGHYETYQKWIPESEVKVKEWVEAKEEWVKEKVADTEESVKVWVEGKEEWVQEKVAATEENVRVWVEGTEKLVKKYVPEAIEYVKQLVPATTKKVKEWVAETAKTVKKYVAATTKTVKKYVAAQGDKLVQVGKNVLDWLQRYNPGVVH